MNLLRKGIETLSQTLAVWGGVLLLKLKQVTKNQQDNTPSAVILAKARMTAGGGYAKRQEPSFGKL